MQQDQINVKNRVEAVFQRYLQEIGYFNEFPMTRIQHHDKNKEFDSPKLQHEDSDNHRSEEAMQNIFKDTEALRESWINGILIIIPTRLGLNKVNKEYFKAI